MFVTPGNTDYVFYKTVLCQLEVTCSITLLHASSIGLTRFALPIIDTIHN